MFFFLQGTLNQGAIEKVFLESLLEAGIVVDRPCRPISLAMSTDTKKLDDPHAYPVKVLRVVTLIQSNCTPIILFRLSSSI